MDLFEQNVQHCMLCGSLQNGPIAFHGAQLLHREQLHNVRTKRAA